MRSRATLFVVVAVLSGIGGYGGVRALTVQGRPHRGAAPAIAAPTQRPRPQVPVIPNPLLGGTVAAARKTLAIYDRPHGKIVRTLGVTTFLGGPQVLLVAGFAPGWVEVRLPVRPNTATGWVPSSSVAIKTEPWSIGISRANHLLTVRNQGIVTASYPVAVGAPATPTPAGLFFVTDVIETGDPQGVFGPAALGLSGHSDVILHFAGADGVLGIHGTNEQASIGKSVSHGCIRMRNSDSLALFHTVPPGTPVVIT